MFSGGHPIRLIVKNSSGETINYLLIVTHDAHMVFDVQSQLANRTKVAPSLRDTFYVSVEGQFKDAQPLKQVGQNFVVNKKPATLYVDVGNTGATFESLDWKKSILQASPRVRFSVGRGAIHRS